MWLCNLKDPTVGSRLARWKIKLSEYQYEICYKPGKVNANADALSRNPIDFINKKLETDLVQSDTRDAAGVHTRTASGSRFEKGQIMYHEYPIKRVFPNLSEEICKDSDSDDDNYFDRVKYSGITEKEIEVIYGKNSECPQYPEISNIEMLNSHSRINRYVPKLAELRATSSRLQVEKGILKSDIINNGSTLSSGLRPQHEKIEYKENLKKEFVDDKMVAPSSGAGSPRSTLSSLETCRKGKRNLGPHKSESNTDKRMKYDGKIDNEWIGENDEQPRKTAIRSRNKVVPSEAALAKKNEMHICGPNFRIEFTYCENDDDELSTEEQDSIVGTFRGFQIGAEGADEGERFEQTKCETVRICPYNASRSRTNESISAKTV